MSTRKNTQKAKPSLESAFLGPTIRYDEEPIAALATCQGRSAIAVIRLSGNGTWSLLKAAITRLDALSPRTTTVRRFRDPSNNEVIDELLMVLFTASASFSGQESAELYCHGGPFIVQKLLLTLHKMGFRAADPGEFTRRAYLNGRIDLTAAEGIRELVNAESEQQWKAAKFLADGRLHKKSESLRLLLVEAMAYLEACIDFPDEGETANLSIRKDVVSRVDRVREALEKMLATYQDGRIAAQGLLVSLIGEPNAGKSTLLNTLLGQARAIVTATPGTTRDFIEEKTLIKGRLIRLVDTAGIRESPDEVERIGIGHAKKFILSSDIILLLIPKCATPVQIAEAKSWVLDIPSEKVVLVETKSDLSHEMSSTSRADLSISCLTGAGLETLLQTLVARVDQSTQTIENEVFVTTARHQAALEAALLGIGKFGEEVARGNYEECLAFELQLAAKALRSLVGEIGSDDLLDKVFADFCIGK